MNLARKIRNIALATGIGALTLTNAVSTVDILASLYNQDFSEENYDIWKTKKSEGDGRKGEHELEVEVLQQARENSLRAMSTPGKIIFYTLFYPGEQTAVKLYQITNSMYAKIK